MINKKQFLIFWDINILDNNLFQANFSSLFKEFDFIHYLPDYENIVDFQGLSLNKENLLDNYFHYKIDSEFIIILEDELLNIYRVLNRNYSAKNIKLSLLVIEDISFRLVSHAKSILDSSKCLLFFDTPHHPIDYIFYTVAKKLNLKIFVTRRLPMPHRYDVVNRRYITSEFPFFDNQIYNQHDIGLYNINKSELFFFIDEYTSTLNKASDYNVKHLGTRWTRTEIVKRLVSGIKKYVFIRPNFRVLYLRTVSYSKTLIFEEYNRRKLLKLYDYNSIDHIDHSRNYVYYPLQYQPEASTVPLGGIFFNQELVINFLDKYLPDNVDIYIKEHPAYRFRLSTNESMLDYRSKAFYQNLINNERIKLVSGKINHYDLIENSIFVVSITGTVLWEAFGFSKFGIAFGNYIYSKMPNIIDKSLLFDFSKLIRFIKENENNLKKEFIRILLNIEPITVPISLKIDADISASKNIEYSFIANYIKENLN